MNAVKSLWLSFLLAVLVSITVAQDDTLSYRDSSLAIEERIENLLSRMTLEEKIGQMTLVEQFSIDPETSAEYMAGGILNGGPRINTPQTWYTLTQSYQQAALNTRLGIPILYGLDAIHGHNTVYGSVIFPHNVGLGSSRNPALMEQIGRVTACNMVATGSYWNFSPVLAVPQDIRWGRYYEGYSQDPELVSLMATSFIRGLQGESLSDAYTVMATPKHFVGDGGTSWSNEYNPNYQTEYNGYPIDRGDTIVSEAELRSIHLAPYVPVLEENIWSVMASFSSWNGAPVHASDYLLTDVLKGELAFEGFVVSDWGAIDLITEDYYEAVVLAINAGVDMNMVPYDYERYIEVMHRAIDNEDISLMRVDDAVRRILRAKFHLGLFEDASGQAQLLENYDNESFRSLGRSAVSQSLVLLQNENHVLPLGDEVETLFIAGAADDIGMQSGGWTISWSGQSGGITPGTTILDGLETALTGTTDIYYNQSGHFDRITDDNGDPIIADTAIVVIGEMPYAEGAGDQEDLSLPDTDVALIERVGDQAETLIVILLSGRPLIISDHLDKADAWVAAWLPGTEGGGIADVLTGIHPFVGTLALTWPRDMSQVPLSALSESGEDPLFPTGWGITTGQIEDIALPQIQCN